MTGNVSVILLCGGRSARMGTDKSRLVLMGKTLLQIQLEKARALGLAEELLCGGSGLPDLYEDAGPLSGLLTGLTAAHNETCLVLPVDLPFLPVSALRALLALHASSSAPATLLCHGGRTEPLAGVYEKRLSSEMDAFLSSGRRTVNAFLDRIPWQPFDPELPEVCFLNCNTPEDWALALRLCADSREYGGSPDLFGISP